MNEKIKVVYVVPLIAPYAIPRYQKLAENSALEVHVIAETGELSERAGWKFQNITGVQMHLLKGKVTKNHHIENKKDGYKMQKTYIRSPELKRTIQSINPDIVLVCNSSQIATLSGSGRKYKLGVIVEDTLRAAEARPLLNKIVKQFMLKKADFYCPFSKDAEMFLKANGIKEPYIRSTWSMDVDFFRDLSLEQITEMKEAYGMKKKTTYIMVSSLIPRKGIMQFLEAWKEMPNDFHDESTLYVLGSGELEENARQYIKNNKCDNVRLEGNKSYSEVSHYLQCGDIFVLPTLEDLCSLSVLEAMAAKKPVLTTIYNGARQFVKDGANGFVFDPLNKADTHRVLKNVMDSDINEMSLASSNMIKEFTTDKVMGRFGDDLISLYKTGV